MPKSKKEKAQEELDKIKRMHSVLNMLEKSALEDLLLYSSEDTEVNADESHIDKRLDQLSKEIENNSKALESMERHSGKENAPEKEASHAAKPKEAEAKAYASSKNPKPNEKKASKKLNMPKNAGMPVHAAAKGHAVKKLKSMARNKKAKVKK